MSVHSDPAFRLPPRPEVLGEVRRAGTRRRRTSVAVGASALSVAALALGLSLLPAAPPSADPSLPVATAPTSCPTEPPAEVPATPVGYDGSERLVPDETPLTMTLCRWRTDAKAAVEGPVTVRSNLEAVRADLSLPSRLDGEVRVCPQPLRIPSWSYLVRLTYDDGSAAWLQSETSLCSTTANGPFTSPVGIADDLDVTWLAESWTRRPNPPGSVDGVCNDTWAGRAGQERDLLPEGWTSLAVCRGQDLRTLSDEQARDVAGLLGRLGTEPFGSTCQDARTSERFEPLALLARFETGRDVRLLLRPSCDNRLSNGSLDAHPRGDDLQQLLELGADLGR